jgi:hypothetical protein
MTPGDALAYRLRELRLLCDLKGLAAIVVLIDDMLAKYESNCADAAAGEAHEYAERRGEVMF